jgi:hypothetical protein
LRQKTNQEHANTILRILNDFAPTGKEQGHLVDIYHEVEKDRPGAGLMHMTGILFDGLTYGNWPWTRTEV